MRLGDEKPIGEVDDEQRSRFDTGGEGGRSSKKDLLLPQTAADIVQLRNRSTSLFLFLQPSIPNCQLNLMSKRVRIRVRVLRYLTLYRGFSWGLGSSEPLAMDACGFWKLRVYIMLEIRCCEWDDGERDLWTCLQARGWESKEII